MAWNIAFSMVAAAAGLIGLRLVDPDPAFDFQVGAPQLDQRTSPPVLSLADAELVTTDSSQGENSKLVSVTFRNARVGDVLSWLDRHGVSYVVDDGAVKQRSITVNIKNQPLRDVIDALGSALGGHWERRGQIHIFVAGPGFFGTYGAMSPWLDGKSFKNGFPDKNIKEWTTPDGKQFKFWATPNGQGQFSPDKSFKLFTTPDKNFKFENGKGWFTPDGKEFKLWSTPDGKSFNFGKGDGVFFMKHVDYDSLLKSLTDKQKDLEKSQGYLTLDDLTPKQREMLGIDHQSGNFEFVFEKDGQKLTIKSK
ncbi:MAG TPA: hypothetical protein VG944_01310 [Fimbriimonas sp.]|nr:hypothetical protein [Fimbriimonas sp.]